MERFWSNHGAPGRESGGAVLRPRGGRIMAGALGRSLPVDGET
jgi:hypothetical protein